VYNSSSFHSNLIRNLWSEWQIPNVVMQQNIAHCKQYFVLFNIKNEIFSTINCIYYVKMLLHLYKYSALNIFVFCFVESLWHGNLKLPVSPLSVHCQYICQNKNQTNQTKCSLYLAKLEHFMPDMLKWINV
jgi:hypothetical protein